MSSPERQQTQPGSGSQQRCGPRWKRLFSGELWHYPDFLKFWAAQSSSQFGSEISLLAVPLVAALTLNASALEMGILTFTAEAPTLLVGLFAGVWADRLRRRPILITADLSRFVLLLIIPGLALVGALQMAHLYAVVFCAGILRVFFDVSYQSYLPSLVKRIQLPEANSKLTMSRSIAQFAGPGLAGGLVRIASAPFAIAVDALTFLLSALFIKLIRAEESNHTQSGTGRSIWFEIREGLQTVIGSPLLRPLAGCTATANFFRFMILAVYVLYVTRVLGIGGGLLGIIFAVGSLGALSGSLAAASMTSSLGIGRTIILGRIIAGVGMGLIPLAQGPLTVTVPILMASRILVGFGSTIYNINQVSLRQIVTPDNLLGRMNASMRFIIWGTIPLGGLLGGILGTVIGLRTTLVVGAIGMFLAVLWVGISQVRTLHMISAQEGMQMPPPVSPSR